MQFLSMLPNAPLPPGACPTCFGDGTVMQIADGQGIVRGACPSCLGDGKARALPRADAHPRIMYQGQHDALVDGYPISGMLAVPGEEGVCYVTRRMAMDFFGLVEPDAEVTAPLLSRIAELTEKVRVDDRLLEERNRLLAAVPACDAHGSACVPHAIEWVKARIADGDKTTTDRLRAAVELLACGQAGQAKASLETLVSEMGTKEKEEAQ